jgi:hypothetical protein
MINFRQWLNEVAEPAKPINKIYRRSITKNGGTWKEKKVLEFKFKTNNENEVKVHFDKIEDGFYDVMFYVNDTQHDDASQNDDIRDSEILGNVLWIIKNKSDQLGINKLKFQAQKGEGDTKIIRNLDVSKYKNHALQLLNNLAARVNSYQVKMIKPNVDLWKKLNRPIPPEKPDLDQPSLNKLIIEFQKLIESNQSIKELLNNNLYKLEELNKLGIDTTEFLNVIKNLSNAIESNMPWGWRRNLNRRAIVWEKLVNKYFADWILKKDGVNFELTRI